MEEKTTALPASNRFLTKKHKAVHHLALTLTVLCVVLVTAIVAFKVFAHGSLAVIQVGKATVLNSDSVAQISQKIEASTAHYQLSLQYTDGTVKIFPLSATGVSIAASNSAQNAKASLNSSLLRRLQWWKPIQLPLAVKTNHAALQSFIDTSATQVIQQSKDASISTNNGDVVLTPGVKGKSATITDAATAIPGAVASLQTAPLLLQDAIVQPRITAQDLKPSQQKIQAILSQKITFDIAGHSVTPSSADIASWIDLYPFYPGKKVDVQVNSGKVLKYIDRVSESYVQPPRARVVANTEQGEVVIDPGANGVSIVNENQAATDVANNLMAGKGMDVQLSVKYASAQTVVSQAYPKWIVVDTSAKRLYAYQNTTLVKTFLVSAGKPSTPTPTGVFHIWTKLTSQTMIGPGYVQPNVPWVNYFDHSGDAIHGVYWRPASYFGNINSSHGCVGLLNPDAIWVYNWAPVGTPVIVHT